MLKKSVLALILAALLAPRAADAHLVRLVVEQTRRLADGQSFGNVGPYERLDGTAYFEEIGRAHV